MAEREIRGKLLTIRNRIQTFWKDESGMGTVEMILIIVVLIALVIIFKTQITSLVNTIFSAMTEDASTVLTD